MREYKYDVFISYSRTDLCFEDKSINPDSIVSKIIQCLNEHNISYWIDLEGIYTGNEFAEKIAVAIEESRTFLFVSSPNSHLSKWTIREIGCAANMERPIIPVRITNEPYPAKISLFLSHLDYVSYKKLGEKTFQVMAASIQQHLETIRKNETAAVAAKKKLAEEEAAELEHQRQLKEKQTRLQTEYDVLQGQISEFSEKKERLLNRMQGCGMNTEDLCDVENKASFVKEIHRLEELNIKLEKQNQMHQVEKEQPERHEKAIPLKKKLLRLSGVAPYIFLGLIIIILVITCLQYSRNAKEIWERYYTCRTELGTLQGQYDDIRQTYPIIIKDIEIGNRDSKGTLETNYGEKLHSSKTMYLAPEITYIGCNTGQTIKLRIKWYDSRGVLSTGPTSAGGYSTEDTLYVESGTNTAELKGWGNDEAGNWGNGTYRIEIWYEGICLGTKTFKIY